MNKKFTNFYDSYQFLCEHSYYNNMYGSSMFKVSLDIDVVKVNPETDAVDDDDSKNTKVQIWLESGSYDDESDACTHDYELDCGGDTFEEAIINLANIVYQKYDV